MLYRNTKTGAVIESSAHLSGGWWEEVPPAPEAGAPAQEKEAARPAGRKAAAKDKAVT